MTNTELEYAQFSAAVAELNACTDEDEVIDLLRREGIKGRAKDCGRCPVAMFLVKRLGPDPLIQVGYYSAWLLRYDHSREIPLEIPVRLFIRAFDVETLPAEVLEELTELPGGDQDD